VSPVSWNARVFVTSLAAFFPCLVFFAGTSVAAVLHVEHGPVLGIGVLILLAVLPISLGLHAITMAKRVGGRQAGTLFAYLAVIIPALTLLWIAVGAVCEALSKGTGG